LPAHGGLAEGGSAVVSACRNLFVDDNHVPHYLSIPRFRVEANDKSRTIFGFCVVSSTELRTKKLAKNINCSR
jgi:hypothetical protein